MHLTARVEALEALMRSSPAGTNDGATGATACLVPNLGTSGIVERYVRDAPHPQLAVDIFEGEWSSILPADLADSRGHAGLFDDSRVHWLIEQCGSVAGWSVLELGPLEAGHSSMLDRHGANVTAIESNSRAYLKCLVIKELLELNQCRFLFGDFNEYLRGVAPRSFDLVLASGVLYHATDPLGTLRNIAQASDRLGLWTHYYDEAVVAGNETVARLFTDQSVEVEVDGRSLTLHRRNYLEALEWAGFCGGPDDHAFWLERDDLLWFLERLGYDDVRIGFDDQAHPNGPNVLVFAAKASAD